MSCSLEPGGPVSFDTDSTEELGGSHALVLLKSFVPTHFFSRDHLDPDKNLVDREGILDLTVGGQHTTLKWSTGDEGTLGKNVLRKLVGRPLFVGPVDGFLTFSARVIESDGKTRAALDKAAKAMKTAASVAAMIPVAGGVAAAGTGLSRAIISAVSSVVDDDSELIFEGSAMADRPGPEGAGLHAGVYRLVRRSEGVEQIALEFIVHGYNPPTIPDGKVRRATVVLRSVDLDPPGRKRRFHSSISGRAILLETVAGGKGTAKTLSLDLPSTNGPAEVQDYAGVANRIVYRGLFTEGMPISAIGALVARTFVEEIQAILEATSGIVDAAVEQDLSKGSKGIGGVVQSARGVVLELLPDWKPGKDAEHATRSMLSWIGLMWTEDPPDFGIGVQRMHLVPKVGEWHPMVVGSLEKHGVCMHLAIKLDDVDKPKG